MSPMACLPCASPTLKSSERPAIVGLAHLLAGSILTFLFLIVALSEFSWVLREPIRGWVLPAAFLSCGAATWCGARVYAARPLRTMLLVTGLLGVLLAVSTWISLSFYDVSFDGQAYHQEGVYQLAHGWNPLYTPNIAPISIDQNVKLIHFSKGPWIIAASMYRLTGRIESGKFATLLLMVAAFCLTFALFNGTRKEFAARPLVMAAWVAANPVALCQVLTFYVDGQMASLLVCLAVLCYLTAVENNPWLEWLLFVSAVLLIQVKFTGVVYVTMLFAGYLLLLAWQRRLARRHVYAALLALGLGICVFGKNPYVYNFFENGHPFYPFFGRGDFPKISMTSTTPPEFLARDRLENLAASVFSRSFDWPPQSTLKAPWKIGRDEWTAFEEPDVLVGGFGPLFAAALLLSLVLLGVGWWQGGRTPRICGAVILIIVGSVLPVSAGWWARYAPQIWMIPFVALLPLAPRIKSRRLSLLLWLTLIVLAINVGGIGYVNLRANWKATRETGEILEDLRSHAPFRVAFGNFRSNRFRLGEAGIPFVEDEGRLSCDPEVKENDDLCIER